ncbi:MAG: helix-turn-helix transcriptional regulator [Hymenobacter sp.]|nr:helix-turn-helix transcriptional regulator [Hymenobacter sp.]
MNQVFAEVGVARQYHGVASVLNSVAYILMGGTVGSNLPYEQVVFFIHLLKIALPMTATTASETVGQRFTQLITHLGISKNAFAASLGKTATVIQHLVDERNKPGFDLLLLVFEAYPNISKDWLLQGVGPMLMNGLSTPSSSPTTAFDKSQTVTVAPTAKEKADAAPTMDIVPIPAGQSTATPPEVVAVASAATTKTVAVDAPQASAPYAALPPTAAAVAPAEAVPAASAGATTPAVSWQTALYTQQMAHQLALAEQRNQHLLEQQRLMQQMLDLMQRQMPR